MSNTSIPKRILIYIYLLALLFSLSCNNSNNNTNSNTPAPNNTAAPSVPVKYYEDSGFSRIEKKPDKLDKEVGGMMKDFLESIALKREDTWFSYAVSDQKDSFLVEVAVDYIIVVASKISDAARRNGKEWAGTVGIHILSYRIFNKEKGLWDKWSTSEGDYPFQYIHPEKVKGKWDRGFGFGLSWFSFRKPKAEEIPK